MIKWQHSRDGLTLIEGKIKKLTIAMMMLSKENILNSDGQMRSTAKTIIDYIAGIYEISDKLSAKNIIDDAPVYNLEDFQEQPPKYIYKYVNEVSAEYYRKGRFQIGSTGYFRKMENHKARDEFEGLVFINTLLGKRIAETAVSLGKNYYVFCGSEQLSDAKSQYHLDNFGSVLLKIELMPFAEKIAKLIGAKSFQVMKVRYSNAKLIKTEIPLEVTKESFSNLDSSDMQQYFQHLVKDCTIPCLFTKSGWFKDELETRLVFEMPHDVNQSIPKRFEHRGLTKYVQFL